MIWSRDIIIEAVKYLIKYDSVIKPKNELMNESITYGNHEVKKHCDTQDLSCFSLSLSP